MMAPPSQEFEPPADLGRFSSVHSARIEQQAQVVIDLLERMRDATIEELRSALAARGHQFGYGTPRRFFKRHRITRKKRPRTPPSSNAPTS
jgi:transposase